MTRPAVEGEIGGTDGCAGFRFRAFRLTRYGAATIRRCFLLGIAFAFSPVGVCAAENAPAQISAKCGARIPGHETARARVGVAGGLAEAARALTKGVAGPVPRWSGNAPAGNRAAV